MRNDLRALTRKYENALRRHVTGLAGRGSANLALALGRQAVSLGLETLDLAKIHEQALAALMPSNASTVPRRNLNKHARAFFVEAIIPIERTHQAAAEAKRNCHKLRETLHARTDELAVSKRDARRKTNQRKASEKTLKKRGEYYTRLLKESTVLQERLRVLTRRAITAQENERGRISRELHEAIVKALLGINVRLSVIAREGALDAKKILKDIALTQRLIGRSKVRLRRVARDFDSPK